MNVTPSLKSAQPIAVLRLAFRPFFLLGSLFSIIALLLWLSVLSNQLSLSFYGGQVWWHAHEMLYGFVAAIIVGFLLTAVKTWTGIPGIKGWQLLLLILVWLIARFLMVFHEGVANWLVALIDIAFLPLAAIVLALPIIKIKQYRNMFFIPLLLVMAATNFRMHWDILARSEMPNGIIMGAHPMIYLVTLLITIMAGRVLPMFTANGTGTSKVPPVKWLEYMVIVSTSLLFFGSLLGTTGFKWLMGTVTLFAACAHFIRFFRWQFWVTVKVPLVWSLHLSYIFIPVGLLLLSLHYWLGILALSTALHTLTVGAMGMMILAMISRVSLGHTGRVLKVGTIMSISFGCLFIAVICRVFLPLLEINYITAIELSVIFWVIAYVLFLLKYAPILMTKRIDDMPG